MASTINAKNTSTGVVITPDASGQLELQTADTTRMTIDVNGNVGINSAGARITGDFSNATIANRVMFQTSTTNGATNVYAIPNGTGTTAGYTLANNSDPSNAGITQVVALSTESSLRSAITGTGTYLPMTFYTGGSERMRITTNGGVAFGGASNFGTSGQVLQSNGDAAPTWTTISTSAFPAGTRMSFQQTSAPTGWTKDTTAALNDSIMRIVTGTASSGGSTAFSTFNGQTATGATTLSTAQMPSHTHSSATGSPTNGNSGSGLTSTLAVVGNSGATGGGGSHTHSMTTAIKYYDFIIASKD